MAVSVTRLESFVKAGRHSARQDLHRKRRFPSRGPIADGRPQYPTRDDIGLPMRLALHACDSIVDRKRLEGPNPGILPRIVRDEGGYEACLQGDFAARETFAAAALEPLIRSALAGTCAAKGALQNGRADPGNSGCVHRLPEGVSQWIVVSKPEAARHLDRDHAELEAGLIVP